jgi:hypothetical protein
MGFYEQRNNKGEAKRGTVRLKEELAVQNSLKCAYCGVGAGEMYGKVGKEQCVTVSHFDLDGIDRKNHKKSGSSASREVGRAAKEVADGTSHFLCKLCHPTKTSESGEHSNKKLRIDEP